MTKERENFFKLKNAPIIEALIDIQFETDDLWDISELKAKIPALLTEDYQTIEERQWFEAGLIKNRTGQMQLSAKDHGTIGYILREPTKSKVVQTRLKGFGFSHLQPYQDFPSFATEAKKYWQAYKEIFSSIKVKKVSLLYINIIDFSKKVNSFQELSNVLKIIPNYHTDGDLLNYASSFQLNENGLSALIKQATMQNVETGFTGVNLQIETFKDFSVNPGEEEIWGSIEELRHLKNKIFFSSISEEKIKEYGVI